MDYTSGSDMATKPSLLGSQSAAVLLLACAPIALGCAARQAPPGTAPAAAPAPGAAPPGAVSPGVTVAPAIGVLRIDLGPGAEIAVDGTPLASPGELGQRVGRAAGQAVTVVVSAGAPESAVGELVAELRKAGVARIDLTFVPEQSALPSPAASSAPGAPPPAAAVGSSLPELTVRTVGIHIGGGPNDDQTKAFFRKRVEERFDDLRRCYPLVTEPGKGGTFGADLAIGREGGQPNVKQPRTAQGAAIQECMVGAFGRINFPKPPRGPTVISYSVRFAIGGK